MRTLAVTGIGLLSACSEPPLTEQEQRVLASFSLARLPSPNTASNIFANNPTAAKLGKQLFSEVRLSSTGDISCATCHKPELYFTDGLAQAEGIRKVLRNTPALAGSAWNQWQYWDGRRDSLWSQALTPLETKDEMGSNRVAVARLILQDRSYRQQYEALFGAIALRSSDLSLDASPFGNDKEKRAWFELDNNRQDKINRVFVNVGKSIDAFEQTLTPLETRFDRFIETVRQGKPNQKLLSKTELRGARLFIDSEKTQCLECHNGPLLSNGDFHNIGTGSFSLEPDAAIAGQQLDFGRVFGVQSVLINEFNCQSRFSDANKDSCNHLRFINRNAISHTQGAFKTPTLRNVPNTAPYFHDGRFASLKQVVEHYAAQPTETDSGQNELRPFTLSDKEIKQLTAFLRSLAAVDQPR